MNRRIATTTVALVLVIVAPVAAEVMDKEPTVAEMWLWAIGSGALAFLVWRWRWWLGAVFSFVAVSAMFSQYQEINDPFVGPAIIAEAGTGYVTQFYLSTAIGCLLHATAAYNARKERRAHP